MNRLGDWMQTFTGKQFWPLDPKAEEVDIEDIAHSLSLQCRFGGHCLRFYSVAEHSVFVSRLVPPDLALVGLLHDATEAYVSDVPKPLKRFLPGYPELEAAVWVAVAERFHLPPVIPVEVKWADTAILLTEAGQNMATPPVPWSTPGEPASVFLQFLSPEKAKDQFLSRFYEIY